MKAKGPKLFKKLRHSGEIQQQDFKYMYEKPEGDIGFSPERNRQVVANVIKKTKAHEAQLKKEYMENVEERVDASVSFLKALARGKYNSSDPHTAAMKYFGRRELARLRGEEIRRELMLKAGVGHLLTES